jgi:hypothetical protein
MHCESARSSYVLLHQDRYKLNVQNQYCTKFIPKVHYPSPREKVVLKTTVSCIVPA